MDESYFEITEDSELGMGGFVATRDIKAGTIILEESPVVFATMAAQPACIACGLIFSPSKPGQKCGKCQWPVCSKKCAEAAVHAGNECELFVSKGFKLTGLPDKFIKDMRVMETFIKMIRVLLLKKNSLDIYNRILELKSEYSVPGIRDKAEWCLEILKPILTSLGLSIEDGELLRLFKIFRINGRCNSASYEDSTCDISALYFKASRMNHSCVPNCNLRMSYPPGFTLRVRTSVNIRKGESLTIPYFRSMVFKLEGTKKRQQSSLLGGFQCKCKRCLDPTELGTYLSAVVCSSCHSKSQNIGYFLPENPLNLNDESSWKCNTCGSIKPASVLLHPIEQAHEMVSSKIENYIKSENGKALLKICKRVENKYSRKNLHPNHWLIQECFRAVVDYFHIPKHAETLDLDTHAYVIKCGYRLLAINDVVSPGWSQQRAARQRQIAWILQINQTFGTDRQNLMRVSDEVHDRLSKAVELYKESLNYFQGDFARTDGNKNEVDVMRSNIQRLENALMGIRMY